ncbi:uncharacterized protein E5676_scaffold46G00440 [Cucumis melo var. makuwa]|uniref:Uncharacterized protein n=1 Tax=Cucumis melo var. makuwa TaxID=1194695 RepID=A0A5D3BTA3_CUCMM|nr:uncharacterized protein E5676_scaffold46G00440 [Cucumis melo var. makuwa]
MEKRMKDHQTPQREQTTNRRSRKPQKIAKCLTASFSSLSEDKIHSISKENSSPISVVSDVNQISDIDSSFLQGVNPEFSACCDTSLFPDLSPSSVVSFDNELLDKVSVDFSGSNDMNEASAGSLEAEIAVNSLRRALTQVLLSTDVDHQSKKLIDASMRIIVDDFLAIPQERDRIAQLISVKNYVLSMCVFLWIVVLAIAFFVGSGVKSSFTGPLPT